MICQEENIKIYKKYTSRGITRNYTQKNAEGFVVRCSMPEARNPYRNRLIVKSCS